MFGSSSRQFFGALKKLSHSALIGSINGTKGELLLILIINLKVLK